MSINASRIIGVAIGMILSFLALVFALCYTSFFLSGEPGLQHGHLNVVIGFIPFLFAFWLTYRFSCTDDLESWEILSLWDFYPKAFLRALLAEVCVCIALGAVIFCLSWIGSRHAGESPHPRATPPPVMKN